MLLLAASVSLLLLLGCTATPPPAAEEIAATTEPTLTPTEAPTEAPTMEPTMEPTAEATLEPTAEATTEPTAEPTIEATEEAAVAPVPSGGVQLSETTVTIDSYPIWDYLIPQTDPTYNLEVFYFNRPQFENASPTPEPVDYLGVVLENPYLRLTFVPELGGRLYSAVIKETGQEVFYHNEVVKPSRYRLLQPPEANWWLATGGMEWAYPTQEHGHRWGVAWEYAITENDDGSATITLSDIAPDRVGVEVDVTLPAESSRFIVEPRLTNNTAQTVPIQFWSNAALALAPGNMSSQTEFIIPADEVIVHSRGELGWNALPGEREPIAWPVSDETNLREYEQWPDHLGFFVPNMDAPFMAAYSPETDLGMIRLVEPGAVPGHKVFGFGTDFQYRDYTDDNSQYFEIWGGINEGFWPEDDVPVASGETVGWREAWWPVAQLGGLTWANDDIALHITETAEGYTLTALASRPIEGEITVSAEEAAILSEPFAATPDSVLQWQIDSGTVPLRIEMSDDNGSIILSYQLQ